MKKDKNKLLLSAIKGKLRIDILRNVCVRNGVAMATDLATWVTANISADNGVYDGDAWRSGRMVPSIEKVEDYPDPPVMGKHIANITSDGISDVIISLPVNDRFSLPGALFVVNGGRKALIATDGHRMHVYGDHKLEGRNFIISKDVCLLLMERDLWGIYEGKKNDFLFFVGDDGVTIITKIIDQKFPNYREVISVTEDDVALLRVWASVRGSVRDSVWDSIWGYIGSFFSLPKEKWLNCQNVPFKKYPLESVVELWERGLVPSFDGTTWRLHGGKNAAVLWKGKL